MTRTGHCHCGAVAYEWDDDTNNNGIVCYCTTCQHLGSSESYNLQTEQKLVRTTKGKPTSYEDHNTDSGKPITRYFCGTCGSTLWSDPASAPGVRFLKVGALDDAKNVKLVAEIYVDTALPHASRPKDAHGHKQFEGMMAKEV
ncbi:hypothetical protein Q8F55_000565 [Vanrija albida]|uniref:CENP-V/GFA domain-containing protein n=1 Tax=Vanrija albida TaxID=181172 RepID=A0ABR3QE60_9TREE